MSKTPGRGDLERLAKSLKSLACEERAAVVSKFWKGTGVPPALRDEYESALRKLSPYLATEEDWRRR